ncbi:MAG: 50S ribosomal protein L4 [Magnetococcus sp. WYHC-3]
MIEYALKDKTNQQIGSVTLSPALFGREVRRDLLARAIQYQLNKRRSGTASTKGRSDVSGGGRKPWKQKGTGNARQGTIRAPQWRTGGVVFGPLPHSHAGKLPKKVRRLALQTAFSAKCAAGELIIIDDFALGEVRTQGMVSILRALQAEQSTLIITAGEDRNVLLSSRNIPRVNVLPDVGANVYDILRHEKLILTQGVLALLEERLGGELADDAAGAGEGAEQ